jgi:hypothetical protein
VVVSLQAVSQTDQDAAALAIVLKSFSGIAQIIFRGENSLGHDFVARARRKYQ